MTTLIRNAKRGCHGLCCALALLALLALLACSREPYPLEDGNPTGELPDQDPDNEADLADPGEEMFVPPDDAPYDRDVSPDYCTRTEIEARTKENTHADGRINEEAIVCSKPSTAPTPAPAPAAQTAPSADQH